MLEVLSCVPKLVFRIRISMKDISLLLNKLDKDYDGVVSSNDKSDYVVGYMLQEDSLFPWLTILDNAILGLKIKKIDNDDNIEYVKKLLETYGLKDFMYKYPSSLSGGMKQRVV